MKRTAWVIAAILIATPVGSQDLGDLGGFLGGDAGGLLNIPAPRGNAPAGNRGAAPRGAQPARPAATPASPAASNAASNAIDRLASLRELLVKANAPLNPEQEAGLNALLNAEIPLMREALQTRVREMQTARGGVPAPPNPDELVPELNRLNDRLLGKLAAVPTLTAQQQSLITKAMKDQIRARGGFDALNLTMVDAGAPFSPEQAAQIESLFQQQNRLRAETADPAQRTQIERETLGKVLRLLTPAQRTALATPISK